MSNKEAVPDFEAVQHVDGVLYKVPLNLIRYADDPSNEEEFVNPRHVQGTPDPKGLEPIPFNELVESIRTTGLQNALILHGKGNLGFSLLTINCGERRKRAIDKLVKQDADCFDPATKTWVKASVLYKTVLSSVHIDISVQQQYKIAFSNNETATGIGDGATITLVKRWRAIGWSDEQILEVTGKSSTWLRDTDALLKLDAQTFDAFVNDQINRTVAIRLSEVADPTIRLTQLANIQRISAERLAELSEKVTKSLEQAIEEKELAEANIADAELSQNEARKKAATKKLKKATDSVKAKENKLNEITSRKPQATSKDMDKLAASEDTSGKLLTHSKMLKHWLPTLEKLISNQGKDEQGHQVCNAEDAILVKYLIEHGIGRNEYEISKLLNHHHQKHSKKK